MDATSLEEAIAAIARQVGSRHARCAITDEGMLDESTLMGTRDGYLNLALALLRFVADADAGRCEVEEGGSLWDDRIKAALYQLPTPSIWLVGASLFANHGEFMKALSSSLDSRLEYPLMNDPSFAEPGGAS